MKRLAILLAIPVLTACGGGEAEDASTDGSSSESSLHDFSSWSADSTQSFLSDQWVQCGRLDGSSVIDDTLGSITTSEGSADRVIKQCGLFHGDDKQDRVPTYEFSFEDNSSIFYKNECLVSDLSSCSLESSPMPFTFLIVNERGIFTAVMRDTSNLDILYVSDDEISIDSKVYKRKEAWKKSCY